MGRLLCSLEASAQLYSFHKDWFILRIYWSPMKCIIFSSVQVAFSFPRIFIGASCTKVLLICHLKQLWLLDKARVIMLTPEPESRQINVATRPVVSFHLFPQSRFLRIVWINIPESNRMLLQRKALFAFFLFTSFWMGFRHTNQTNRVSLIQSCDRCTIYFRKNCHWCDYNLQNMVIVSQGGAFFYGQQVPYAPVLGVPCSAVEATRVLRRSKARGHLSSVIMWPSLLGTSYWIKMIQLSLHSKLFSSLSLLWGTMPCLSFVVLRHRETHNFVLVLMLCFCCPARDFWGQE